MSSSCITWFSHTRLSRAVIYLIFLNVDHFQYSIIIIVLNVDHSQSSIISDYITILV